MNQSISQELLKRTEPDVKPDFDAILTAGLDGLADGWCVWRYTARDGSKPAKTPYAPGGRKLNVAEPDAWRPFEAVTEAYASGGFDGVGLLMSSTKNLVGLDLDGCLAVGEVVPAKSEIVAEFLGLGGYVEVSPSGTGLRQFLRGCRLEDFGTRGRTGTGLEIYDNDDKRYLTVTGTPYPAGSEARPVIANQTELEAFIGRWCDPQTTVGGAGPGGAGEVLRTAQGGGRTVAEVLKLLRTHNRRGKIIRLLAGDLSDHSGDHSAADLDLACEAAYFTRAPAVIDAIMRQSGIMRPKWDEKRGPQTYGQRTIQAALEKQIRSFDEDQAAKATQVAKRADEMSHLDGGGEDLRTKAGWRSDLWALTELLVRDRRLMGAVFFDDFAGWPIVVRSLREVLGDRSAPTTVGRVQDAHLAAMTRWFGRSWGLKLPIKDVAAAVEGWARVLHRNPCRERLEELGARWDGKARLDDWLVSYCGAKTSNDDGEDITPYVQAVGTRWVLSVAARAMQPGCKVDSMLVLEGKQGTRKSSAARALAEAVGADYFREGFNLDSGGKDDLIALCGRLIVEWGELSGMGKRDREHLKNFLSQQTDSYRAVYGLTETDWPRTAVFLGTTNEGQYLADTTGNRRFWPVKVGRINLDRLRKDAGQLWGEAVRRYQSGERWWFEDSDPRDAALMALAQGEQLRRVGGTLWAEAAAELADRLIAGQLQRLAGGVADSVEAFRVEQVRAWLMDQTGIEIADTAWLRVADGLKAAGWESVKLTRAKITHWRLTAERREAGTIFF